MQRFQFKLEDITLIEYNEALTHHWFTYVPERKRKFWFNKPEYIRDKSQMNSKCYNIEKTLARLRKKHNFIMREGILVRRPHIILHLNDGSTMEQSFDTVIGAKAFVRAVVGHNYTHSIKGCNFEILT